MFGSSEDRARQLAYRKRRERVISGSSSIAYRSFSSSSQLSHTSRASSFQAGWPSLSAATLEHSYPQADGTRNNEFMPANRMRLTDPADCAPVMSTDARHFQDEQHRLQAEHLSQVLYDSLPLDDANDEQTIRAVAAMPEQNPVVLGRFSTMRHVRNITAPVRSSRVPESTQDPSLYRALPQGLLDSSLNVENVVVMRGGGTPYNKSTGNADSQSMSHLHDQRGGPDPPATFPHPQPPHVAFRPNPFLIQNQQSNPNPEPRTRPPPPTFVQPGLNPFSHHQRNTHGPQTGPSRPPNVGYGPSPISYDQRNVHGPHIGPPPPTFVQTGSSPFSFDQQNTHGPQTGSPYPPNVMSGQTAFHLHNQQNHMHAGPHTGPLRPPNVMFSPNQAYNYPSNNYSPHTGPLRPPHMPFSTYHQKPNMVTNPYPFVPRTGSDAQITPFNVPSGNLDGRSISAPDLRQQQQQRYAVSRGTDSLQAPLTHIGLCKPY